MAMASPFNVQVSVSQIGSYFVNQYYQFLQKQPHMVHNFYQNISTMMRLDGAETETASGMQQIHNLIMCLNFTAIEIKTAHSLDSWNGGVLVMVMGFVQIKDHISRRKFVQTFFLAPQDNGYFVLNDIFHLLEEEQIQQHSASFLAQFNYENSIIASNNLPEPVSEYNLGEVQAREFEVQAREYEVQAREFEVQGREFAAPIAVEGNVTVDKHSVPGSPQQLSEPDENLDETPAEAPVASFQTAPNAVHEPPPAPVEEPVGEQPRHTYASILRASKGQSGQSVPHPASSNKSAPVATEWHYTSQAVPQQSQQPENFSSSETVEEVAAFEDEGEERSVYVGNLPPSISASDLEQEFKKFGRLRPDGVAVRSRKDSGVYYAFVEFEDAIGVHNALKASPVELNGRLIHVEGRRPNSSAFRGGRRGRGRGGYQTEAPRGRFGNRTFGRGNGGQDNNDRDYSSRSRGNGYVQRGLRQDRGILGSQGLRNGQSPSEAYN